MTLIRSECIIQSGTHNRFVVEEKGKKFTLVNEPGYHVEKIQMDNCVIKEKSKTCDFLMKVDDPKIAYFIELKGDDVPYACRQILQSYNYLKPDLTGYRIEARIVCRKNTAPKYNLTPHWLALQKVVGPTKGRIYPKTNNELTETCK